MTLHGTPGRSQALVAVATGLLLFTWAVLLPSPAYAAPPSNDDVRNARVITTIPYLDEVDATEATAAPGDSMCGTTPDLGSVWYSFNPATSGTYQFDTIGSGTDTTLAIFRGRPGSLTLLDCNDDTLNQSARLVGDLTAATTYYIEAAIAIFPQTTLKFAVTQPADPYRMSLTVDDKLTFSGTTVTIAGTVTCNHDLFMDQIGGTLRQKQGLNIAVAGFFTFEPTTCTTTPTRWSVVATASRPLLAKAATVRVEASGCDADDCAGDLNFEEAKLVKR